LQLDTKNNQMQDNKTTQGVSYTDTTRKPS